MHWQTKARIFRALSITPMGDHIHYFLQRRVTKELPRRVGGLDELLVATRNLHADARRHLAEDLGKARFVEIGAGRDLAVAITLRLLGVGHVTCVDVTRLAKLDLIQHAANHMAGKLMMSPPKFKTWADLEAFGISYLAPHTLQTAALPAASVDCFFSVDTLEHIPRAPLADVLTEGKRILKPDGLCLHFVDYSDHYARGGVLSRFNFLKFTTAEWDQYNSRFHYVNRMRHSEFLALFAGRGFDVSEATPDVEPVQDDIVATLAPEFLAFARDDLFTIRAKIIARPGAMKKQAALAVAAQR